MCSSTLPFPTSLFFPFSLCPSLVRLDYPYLPIPQLSPIVQLVSIFACHVKDRGSNPRWRVFSFFLQCSCALDFPFPSLSLVGGVAHMVEHSLCMRGARGSIPRTSTLFLFFMPSLYMFYLFSFLSFFAKKRQRQGSNLRSQREIAQQATALTTRPRCLSSYPLDTPLGARLFSKKNSKTTVAGFEPTHPEDN